MRGVTWAEIGKLSQDGAIWRYRLCNTRGCSSKECTSNGPSPKPGTAGAGHVHVQQQPLGHRENTARSLLMFEEAWSYNRSGRTCAQQPCLVLAPTAPTAFAHVGNLRKMLRQPSSSLP
jgi:hypothetical protein